MHEMSSSSFIILLVGTFICQKAWHGICQLQQSSLAVLGTTYEILQLYSQSRDDIHELLEISECYLKFKLESLVISHGHNIIHI